MRQTTVPAVINCVVSHTPMGVTHAWKSSCLYINLFSSSIDVNAGASFEDEMASFVDLLWSRALRSSSFGPRI